MVDDGRTAYSGTHETTAFGERSSGNVLLVTIEAGGPPSIETVPTGGLRWVVVGDDRAVGSREDLTDVVRIVDGLADPDRILLKVILEGLLPAGATETLRDLEILMEARFLFSAMDRDRLIPSPADPGWIESLPAEGVEAAVARRLLALADAEPVAGVEPTPAVAVEALQLLFRLEQEATR
ncbi:MAG: hypothetical protein ABIK09_12100 [Pseudomonadota bacterium]